MFFSFERNPYFRQLPRALLYGSCCCSVCLSLTHILIFLLPPAFPLSPSSRFSPRSTVHSFQSRHGIDRGGASEVANDRLLGNVRFLGFYLVGGIASTMASLFWRRLRGDHTTSSEGASGAIYSCMGMSFLLSDPSSLALSANEQRSSLQCFQIPNSYYSLWFQCQLGYSPEVSLP